MLKVKKVEKVLKPLLKKQDFLLSQVFFCKKKCFGIQLSHILIVLSVFTISLALDAYIRRSMIPERDRRKDF